ncbi:MAG: hypothetical protein RI995_1622 [Bacteroidota bacterium]|jgi:hypothetical protein
MMTEETTSLPEENKEEIQLSVEAEQIFPTEEKHFEIPTIDLPAGKAELLAFFEKLKAIVAEQQNALLFKKVEEAMKDAKSAFEAIKTADRNAAFEKFKSDNEGAEEGFDFKGDEIDQKIDSVLGAIRSARQLFFQQLEKQKDKIIEGKTRLLDELRKLVDADDNSDPAHVNASFKAFKKIQEEWKSLGNIQGPQNQSFWQSYHALVDRFYSNRSIFFELLELDRKKNVQAKEIIAGKLEALAAKVNSGGLQKLLKEAEELFEEYKHIGPAHKEANEALWQRVKKALDVLFAEKRQILDAQKAVFEENLKIKKELVDLMKHYTNFTSASIAEWNNTSKSVLALQDQWGKLKGGVGRDAGKEVSHEFWTALKQFFKNKSEFFAKIDAERKANLAAKQELIDKVNAFVEAGDESADNTNLVIELQKKWKEIGHVPEKQKDQIYHKFKAACDAFFNMKREKSKGAKDAEFEGNLTAKQALLSDLKAMLKDANLLADLKAKKEAWDAIGFVPKKNLKEIQDEFRTVWNQVIDLARTQPKEQLAAWGFELKGLPTESAKEERKPISADNKKKIQALENEIATLTNNLEFFAKSKNADKLIAEVEKKIEKAEKELAKLKG